MLLLGSADLLSLIVVVANVLKLVAALRLQLQRVLLLSGLIVCLIVELRVEVIDTSLSSLFVLLVTSWSGLIGVSNLGSGTISGRWSAVLSHRVVQLRLLQKLLGLQCTGTVHRVGSHLQSLSVRLLLADLSLSVVILLLVYLGELVGEVTLRLLRGLLVLALRVSLLVGRLGLMRGLLELLLQQLLLLGLLLLFSELLLLLLLLLSLQLLLLLLCHLLLLLLLLLQKSLLLIHLLHESLLVLLLLVLQVGV